MIWFAIYWMASFTIVVMLSSREKLGALHPGTWIALFFASAFLVPVFVIVAIMQIFKKK